MKKLANSAICFGLVVATFSATHAQKGWAQIDEVIVTTRKRAENLQDVPLSVSTLNAVQIQNRGIDDIGDIAKFTAGIEFDEGYGAQDTRVTIRGLSQTRGRPNAAILVDGIDFTGEAVSTAGGGYSVNRRLLDLERIEVVKGPQSALYGRSAFAGAIQYITKTPSLTDFEAEAGFDISVEEDYEATGVISGPVVEDRLGFRLNGVYWNEEGYHDSVLTGESVGGGEGWGIGGTVLFEPNETISAKMRVAYSEDEFDVRAQARVPNNLIVDIPPNLIGTSGLAASLAGNYPTCASSPTPGLFSCLGLPKPLVAGKIGDDDGLAVIQSPDPRTGREYDGTEIDALQITSVIDWDLDFGTLTSYTGYLDADSKEIFDATSDALPAGSYESLDGTWSFVLPPCGFADCSPYALEVGRDNNTTLFSQELRFASNFDGPFQFTIGANYWREDVEQIEEAIGIADSLFRGRTDFSTLAPAAAIIPSAEARAYEKSRDTKHWSSYLLLEWDISDQFKLSLEGRYVEEDIDNVGPVCDAVATEALTGLASTDVGVDLNGDGVIETTGAEAVPDGIDDICNRAFRGASSAAPVAAAGSLPAGIYANPVTVPILAKSSESFFTPKATIEWTPNEDQLYYFSFADAVKPGGISSLTAGGFFDPENARFDEEKLRIYELGGKTSWRDGTLVLNGAVYFQEFTDKQVSTTQYDARIESDIGSIENAGEAEIFGIELEGTWQVTDTVTLGAGYSYIDAEYTSFKSQTNSANEIARLMASGNGGCLSVVDIDPGPDVVETCIIDRTGNRIEDIPKHAFVGTAEYRAPLDGLSGLIGQDADWFFQTNVAYTGERYTDENNLILLDDYITTDFRLGVSSDRLEFLIYVDNAFDDDTVKSGQGISSIVNTFRQGFFPPSPSDGFVVNLPDPRVIGFRGKVKF